MRASGIWPNTTWPTAAPRTSTISWRTSSVLSNAPEHRRSNSAVVSSNPTCPFFALNHCILYADINNRQEALFRASGDPVISVDTQKKELVGAFQNPGRTWRPKGRPEQVRVHDFPSQAEGHAIPYGTYDVA